METPPRFTHRQGFLIRLAKLLKFLKFLHLGLLIVHIWTFRSNTFRSSLVIFICDFQCFHDFGVQHVEWSLLVLSSSITHYQHIPVQIKNSIYDTIIALAEAILPVNFSYVYRSIPVVPLKLYIDILYRSWHLKRNRYVMFPFCSSYQLSNTFWKADSKPLVDLCLYLCNHGLIREIKHHLKLNKSENLKLECQRCWTQRIQRPSE